MGLPTKISFLHIAMSVLLLCEVTLLIDAARGYYPGKRPSASAYRFRRKGCKDESRGRATCIKLVKEMGMQVCYTDVAPLKAKLERSCGETCKFCGGRPKDCRTSIYGCCWDAYTPRGDVYGIKGCPECKNHLRLCKRFKKFCGQDSENGAFMDLHCPLTCGRCRTRRDMRISGQKIKMSDWGKL